MRILDEIDRVFQIEIETLVNTRSQLNESFADATNMLFQTSGKIVVTGMGKSGLIAQKISATMVSTGTDALYVHPAEASHGDAGAIKRGDTILAISKSGETEELLSLLPYINRIGANIICITANRESTLAKNSLFTLLTPVYEEACPLDLAPTSSTTAALVVGDALAMTLMKLKGVQADDFALNHPGGQLGRRLLLTVADTMRSKEFNPIVRINDTVQHMLYEISSKRCGAVSIIDGDYRLVGLVTDRDVRRVLEDQKNLFELRISDIMNSEPTWIHSETKAVDALNLMKNRDQPFVVLPVINSETQEVIGMLHLHDLVKSGI